ncbi:hypothetical protein HDV00_011218, partial [Rhizophlyctis rosea]
MPPKHTTKKPSTSTAPTPFMSEYRSSYRDPKPPAPKFFRKPHATTSTTDPELVHPHHLRRCEVAHLALEARKAVGSKGRKGAGEEKKNAADQAAERRLDEALGEGKGRERKVKFKEDGEGAGREGSGEGRRSEGTTTMLPPLPTLTTASAPPPPPPPQPRYYTSLTLPGMLDPQPLT